MATNDAAADESLFAAGMARDKRLKAAHLVIALVALVTTPVLVAGVRPLVAGKTVSRVDRLTPEHALLAKSLAPDKYRVLETTCHSEDACVCAEATGLSLLDLGEAKAATQSLERVATACGGRTTILGLLAEAKARQGELDRALVLAADALERGTNQRNARYARALVFYQRGQDTEALSEANQAASAGRGAPAHALMGMIELRQQKLASARDRFERALRLDANDIDTRYNLALVAHRMDAYKAAREGYLAVLRRSPKHADARYNLVVLTHSEGATSEAAHHFSELLKIVPPGDERVRKLAPWFAQPAPTPGLAVSAEK